MKEKNSKNTMGGLTVNQTAKEQPMREHQIYGYGYKGTHQKNTIWIPCTVLSTTLSGKRLKVRFKTADGTEIVRFVKPEKVREVGMESIRANELSDIPQVLLGRRESRIIDRVGVSFMLHKSGCCQN